LSSMGWLRTDSFKYKVRFMPAIRTIELPARYAGFRLYDSARATDCSSLPSHVEEPNA